MIVVAISVCPEVTAAKMCMSPSVMYGIKKLHICCEHGPRTCLNCVQ